MVYLTLAIVCSVLIGFIFKLFYRYGVDAFQAIVVNYFVCLCCGVLHIGRFPVRGSDLEQPWLFFAVLLGFTFISGFNGAALTVRHFGVTVSQIMQKMSILMTVPFAILVYGESSGPWKITGFLLALAAIILVNWPSADKRRGDTSVKLLWIPLITWVLAGIIEVLFITVHKERHTDVGDPAFITTVFGTAGLVGLVIAVAGAMSGRLVFSPRNIGWGILLGIPNYGSMLFTLLALGGGLEGSLVFPFINVGIIIATTIGAVWLFQEQLSGVNWLGILLAVAAIVFISV